MSGEQKFTSQSENLGSKSGSVNDEVEKLIADQFDEEIGEVAFEGVDERTAAYQAAVGEKIFEHEREAERQKNLDTIILSASSQIRNKIVIMGWNEEVVEDVISLFAKKVRATSVWRDLPSVQEGTDTLYKKMIEEIERREMENATIH